MIKWFIQWIVPSTLWTIGAGEAEKQHCSRIRSKKFLTKFDCVVSCYLAVLQPGFIQWNIKNWAKILLGIFFSYWIGYWHAWTAVHQVCHSGKMFFRQLIQGLMQFCDIFCRTCCSRDIQKNFLYQLRVTFSFRFLFIDETYERYKRKYQERQFSWICL